jgi:hypothetical protein
MFYFTKRSTRPAFSGLSEMLSISRHTTLDTTTPNHTRLYNTTYWPSAFWHFISGVPRDLIPIICCNHHLAQTTTNMSTQQHAVNRI